MALDLNSLPKVGELVTFKHRGVSFTMQVINARIRYGQVDVLISPLQNGEGQMWVTYDSVKSTTPIDKALAS